MTTGEVIYAVEKVLRENGILASVEQSTAKSILRSGHDNRVEAGEVTVTLRVIAVEER